MKLLAPALTLLALPSCMAPANPPSLERRAIETRADPVATPSPAAVAGPVDASLAARITATLNEVKLGDDAFAAADRETGAAIRAGAGASVGSERWIAAEQARSALQAASQRSSAALAALDAMLLEQATAPTGTGGYEAVVAAKAEAEAVVDRQKQRLESLSR